MKQIFIFVVFVVHTHGFATVFQVGSTRTYPTPNALYLANVVQDGDTIEIDAETFIGQAALAVWQSNNLLIKGVGGRPHLEAAGQSIWGKGIWVLAGNDITVENIEFSGAAVPDENGAGIRLDGIGLTVRSCYFHDNENGILTSNPYEGDILVEFSEFNHNGFGDGYSHNLYIGHVNSLTFRFNYSHHAVVGHNLKSRANENYIVYNRIMDEETGNSSRLIDLPNGGFSIVMGNLLMQGVYAENNNAVGYGLEGLSNSAPHEFYVINNTFVNKREASCVFVAIENGTANANVSNNIFAGTGTVISGTTTTEQTNYANSNIVEMGFLDESNYDYQLTTNSPVIDFGSVQGSANGYSLTPDFVYIHPTSSATRTIVSTIDAGAYEFESLYVNDTPNNRLLLYPNPTQGLATVNLESATIKKVTVFNATGQVVFSKTSTNKVDLTNFLSGIYHVQFELNNGKQLTRSLVKK